MAEPEIRLENGDAEISCTPSGAYKNIVRAFFEAVCIGFALLEEKYPDVISYHVHG